MALPRQMPDIGFERMVHEAFTHTCTLEPKVGDDLYGQPRYGPPKRGVPCFIGATSQRAFTGPADIEVPDWQIQFPPTVRVGVGDRLKNGADMDGYEYFTSAVISYVDDSVSSTQGRLQWFALAKEQ